MSGILYVVATPLGNLGDMSTRGIETLRAVHVIFAEDTRRTQQLLRHFGIKGRLVSLHAHNEHKRCEAVLDVLARSESAALVSDAGTPAVSDPGAEVVAAAHRAGFTVTPIPGPSALAAALSAAGFAESSSAVLFAGFLPSKGKARRDALASVGAFGGAVVLYEGPHRLGETLAALAEIDPQREICLCRELTKLHEEVRRAPASELATWARGEVRGEITLVLGPTKHELATPEDAEIDAALRRCFDAGLSARDSASAVAAVLKRPKRAVYQRAMALQS